MILSLAALSIRLAHAEPPVDAPSQLSIDFPAAGAVRAALPPDVAGADPADLARTLRLLDATGQDVPFTVALTEPVPMEEALLDLVPLGPGSWRVGPSERPVERLRFTLDDLDDVGPVRVGVVGGPETVLAEATLDGEVVVLDELAVERGRGPWTITARSEQESVRLVAVRGQATAPEMVAETCGQFAAEAPVTTESGMHRYAVELGGPRRVQSLRVETSEALFDRSVTIGAPGESRNNYGFTGRVRRLVLAGSEIDRSWVRGLDLGADALVVDIAAENGRVLPVTGFEVCWTSAEILARDVGEGPHTLYVGGEGHDESWDLAQARIELLRAGQRVTLAGELLPNPAFVSRTDREGVAEPAAPLALLRWRWARPIEGVGWVRIPLDRTVLAHARADLADLRVVDAEGREVPSILRRTGRETAWEASPFTREEVGNKSRIRIDLGSAVAPVATVTLTTPRGVFHRQVTVLRDRGAMTEPLRIVNWDAGEEAGPGTGGPTLAIAVDDVVGRELMLEIDNGSNPPLDVTTVSVTFPGWEVRAKVGEGARLLYGAPGEHRPAYDLSLLQGEVLRQAAVSAKLGDETAIGGPALGGFEKTALGATVAMLALGLLAMTIRVLVARDASQGDSTAG